MSPSPASVVIVSQGRPEWLARAAAAVLDQHPAQLIVVADHGAMAGVPEAPNLTRVVFNDANISTARNLGLAQVQTPVVAFIDDDALPEPAWLDRLGAAFADPEVHAATGFTRLGDGPRWQSQGEWIDRRACVRPLRLAPDRLTVLRPPVGGAIVTLGTNCAFRTDVLQRLGGFDPVFRYYLDESDVNMRLADQGALTAVVPSAVVRHYRASGPYRRADGQLKSHTVIGQSLRAFVARHGPSDDIAAALSEAVDLHERRLLRAMIRGDLEPHEVLRGRKQLRRGAELRP